MINDGTMITAGEKLPQRNEVKEKNFYKTKSIKTI